MIEEDYIVELKNRFLELDEINFSTVENLRDLLDILNKVDGRYTYTGVKKSPRVLKIKKPKGYMNCGISLDNYFIADTNDSQNWDKIQFPLPEGNWNIYAYHEDDIVELRESN